MAITEDLGARVFGARIRARRKYNDLTLNELAIRAGISRAALSKIERGEQDTSVSNAMGLSRALGVEVGELLAPPEVVITASESIPA
ncbi:MAG: helix-turn-helix domain-containing protein, partial [Brevibacterium sp.]|nr:helix-turn-helix domain-containing protein [Brevibacterium sp.]